MPLLSRSRIDSLSKGYSHPRPRFAAPGASPKRSVRAESSEPRSTTAHESLMFSSPWEARTNLDRSLSLTNRSQSGCTYAKTWSPTWGKALGGEGDLSVGTSPTDSFMSGRTISFVFPRCIFHRHSLIGTVPRTQNSARLFPHRFTVPVYFDSVSYFS